MSERSDLKSCAKLIGRTRRPPGQRGPAFEPQHALVSQLSVHFSGFAPDWPGRTANFESTLGKNDTPPGRFRHKTRTAACFTAFEPRAARRTIPGVPQSGPAPHRVCHAIAPTRKNTNGGDRATTIFSPLPYFVKSFFPNSKLRHERRGSPHPVLTLLSLPRYQKNS